MLNQHSPEARPMFPHTIDSTMLSSFRSCPNKFLRTYIQHWKPKAESVHLVAGKAFASGIERARKAFFEEGISAEDAEALGMQALFEAYGDFTCPPDSAKSLERMAGALEFYFSHYPLAEDSAVPITFPGSSRRGIEFSFAVPLPISHPVSGDPILYTGRMDMIADFAGGVYIFDEKTTSSLGASWSRQWDMRSQFTGYQWALQQEGIDCHGTVVRGVSILKTKYDTQQAITTRGEFELDRWLLQTLKDIESMKSMWHEGYWHYNLDNACNDYGGCSLQQVCKSPEPEGWLGTFFEQRVWDPLARQEWTLAEWEESWATTNMPPVEKKVIKISSQSDMPQINPFDMDAIIPGN